MNMPEPDTFLECLGVSFAFCMAIAIIAAFFVGTMLLVYTVGGIIAYVAAAFVFMWLFIALVMYYFQ